MALTKTQLDQIHLRKLATPGTKYYGDDEKVYIGTNDKRLKLFEDAYTTNFKPTDNLKSKQVQLAIEELDSNLTEKITALDFDFTKVFMLMGG